MSKPFLIINVVEGKVGTIKERPTWKQAVDAAVKLAADQCGTPKENIRAELEQDSDFLSPNGDINVVIAQADDE